MKKVFPLKIATWGTIVILSCIILFHFLVLAGAIPSDIVWGGNLVDKSQLYTMEAISILVNSVMLFTILIFCRIVKLNVSRRIIIAAIWFMFGLFLLNTLGNLMAKNSLETYIFTPLTFLLSVFCFRIAAYEQ